MLTEKEMQARLDAGENPLPMSIEAWEGKRAWIQSGGSFADVLMGMSGCPLCLAHWAGAGDCTLCPYLIYYKVECSGYEEPSRAYHVACETWRNRDREGFVEAASLMIAELIDIWSEQNGITGGD